MIFSIITLNNNVSIVCTVTDSKYRRTEGHTIYDAVIVHCWPSYGTIRTLHCGLAGYYSPVWWAWQGSWARNHYCCGVIWCSLPANRGLTECVLTSTRMEWRIPQDALPQHTWILALEIAVHTHIQWNSYHVNQYTPTLSLSRGQVFEACTIKSRTLADDIAWSCCSFSSFAAKNDMTCNNTWSSPAPPLILQHLQYQYYEGYQQETGVIGMAQTVPVGRGGNKQDEGCYEGYEWDNNSLLLISSSAPPLQSADL